MSEVNTDFMRNYAFDITNRYADQNKVGKKEATSTDSLNGNDRTDVTSKRDPSGSLTFEDMLLLMVTQMQNQGIDSSMDTKDMMNQIIQMTVMQAITEMNTKVEDLTEANILSYSASLVGKTVTMAILDDNGNLAGEKVGEVTATGTYNGQRVIYVDGERFPINQILAVGTLPERPGGDESTTPGTDENGSGTDAAEETVEKALG